MVMQIKGRGLLHAQFAVLTTACVSRRQAFPLAWQSEIGRQEIKMLSIARFV